MKKLILQISLFLVAIILISCSSITNQGQLSIKKTDKFYIVSFKNNTETYLAGERASNITKSLLSAKGYNIINITGSSTNEEKFDIEKIKEHAKSSGANIILLGEVNEWRYKTGIDGEPAVGLSISFYDLDKNEVIWTAVGAKSGWGHESISTIAQKLLNEMIK